MTHSAGLARPKSPSLGLQSQRVRSGSRQRQARGVVAVVRFPARTSRGWGESPLYRRPAHRHFLLLGCGLLTLAVSISGCRAAAPSDDVEPEAAASSSDSRSGFYAQSPGLFPSAATTPTTCVDTPGGSGRNYYCVEPSENLRRALPAISALAEVQCGVSASEALFPQKDPVGGGALIAPYRANVQAADFPGGTSLNETAYLDVGEDGMPSSLEDSFSYASIRIFPNNDAEYFWLVCPHDIRFGALGAAATTKYSRAQFEAGFLEIAPERASEPASAVDSGPDSAVTTQCMLNLLPVVEALENGDFGSGREAAERAAATLSGDLQAAFYAALDFRFQSGADGAPLAEFTASGCEDAYYYSQASG